MIHHRFFHFNLRDRHLSIYLSLIIIIVLGCLAIPSFASKPKLTSPDILIMILSGNSQYDNVSIEYTTEVSDKTAEADLKELVKATRWQVGKYDLTTDSATSPGAKLTTSISFATPRIVVAKDGLLPIEPFIDVFKRFSKIQVNYLITTPFKFNGLKNFENDFVKVALKQSGISYQYTVHVKSSDFKTAQLPLQFSASNPLQQSQAGFSPALRIFLIILLALLGSVSAYFMAAYICKRRKIGE